jgi:hypothetical protein
VATLRKDDIAPFIVRTQLENPLDIFRNKMEAAALSPLAELVSGCDDFDLAAMNGGTAREESPG